MPPRSLLTLEDLWPTSDLESSTRDNWQGTICLMQTDYRVPCKYDGIRYVYNFTLYAYIGCHCVMLLMLIIHTMELTNVGFESGTFVDEGTVNSVCFTYIYASNSSLNICYCYWKFTSTASFVDARLKRGSTSRLNFLLNNTVPPIHFKRTSEAVFLSKVSSYNLLHVNFPRQRKPVLGIHFSPGPNGH